jgi:RNA polymerase-binding transcription factor DksA
MDTTPYRNALEAERETLTAALQELGVHNPENDADWVTAQTLTPEADANMVADHTEAYDERRATLAQLETRWNEVRYALEKIDAGTYGICEISGEVIEPERLHANPAARTCIAHKDDALDR